MQQPRDCFDFTVKLARFCTCCRARSATMHFSVYTHYTRRKRKGRGVLLRRQQQQQQHALYSGVLTTPESATI